MESHSSSAGASKEQFWRRALRRYQASGLSIRAFCQREGLRECNFYAWRREIQRRDQLDERPVAHPPAPPANGTQVRASFLPLRVLPDGLAGSAAPRSIESVLSGGPTVRVPDGFDRRTLSDVLIVLGSQPC